MTNLENALKKLNLDENEAKIYLACLALDTPSAGQIAKKTEIKRPTVYLHLESLKAMGIISETYQENVKRFKAITPVKLEKITKKMRRDIVDAEITLEELIPHLQAIEKSSAIIKPEVSFYEGIEGLKNIIYELTAYRKPWHFFGSTKKAYDSLPKKHLEELLKESEKMREMAGRPTVYFITDKSRWALDLKEKKQPHIRKIKFLPKPLETESAWAIYGNKLAVWHAGNHPYGFIITSKEITENAKVMFKLLWEKLDF